MSFDRKPLFFKSLSVAALLTLVGYATATDLSQTPLSTYGTAATDVKPNVLFVLDDSGSMDWDFMPDWACASQSTTNSSCSSTGQDPLSARSEYLFRNAAYNGVYYNPAVQYSPPIAVGSTGSTNTTTYLSQTGASTTQGADSTTKPNWNAVKNDAYGVQSTSTTSFSTTTPQYYTTIAGEYCTSNTLKTCQTATAASGTYTFPAPIRWCDSAALTNCQAAFSPTYAYVRAPAPRTTSITFNTAASGATITDISVGSDKILPASVTAATTADMAKAVAAGINACNGTKTGNCTVAGFAASFSGSTVTITAAAVATASLSTALAAPSITKTGTLTWATIGAFSTNTIPGYTVLTIIVPGTTALYPVPGTTAKGSTRSDCAATTCTGNEETTNYANWWTYYRTRMQMMKTSASNAFSAIDSVADITAGKSSYRLGYMTINNNTSTDFVNLGEFTGTQKYNWYSKLLKANPSNSTPLRTALSKAGRLYGGMLNGTSLNGVTVTEPLQYACQRNYTILSTDGFWNGGAGYKLDGSTAVGNQDGGLAKPLGDGGSTALQKRTSKLQISTAPLLNQYRNSILQVRTFGAVTAPSLQKSTSGNNGNSWSAWADATSCTPDNSGKNQTQCQYPISTSTDGGVTWSAWGYAASCNAVTSGTNRTACSGSVNTWGAWGTATATCTKYSGTPTVGSKDCQYTTPNTSWTNTTNNAVCSAVARSSASPFTVLTAVECQQVPGTFGTFVDASGTCTTSTTTKCQYTTWTAWGTISSCTAAAQTSASPFTQLTATQCQTVSSGGTSDTLADVAAYYYNTDLRTASPANTADTTGPCATATGTDLCGDSVPAGGKRDEAKWQHMTTFTLGLGSQGQMIYAPNTLTGDYWNDTSGDFYSILTGVTASSTNVAAGICSWMSSGQCTWPTPAANSNANIDDLWHAAINGHGSYFSAKDPASLTNSLVATLSQIPANNRTGTSAAAASSNPNVTSTDNYIFSSSYRSGFWTGELTRRQILATGDLTLVNWSAARLVDCSTTVWAPNTAYSAKAAFRYPDSTASGGVPKCYVVNTDYTSGSTFDISGSTGEGGNTSVVNEDETATSKTAVAPNLTRKIYTNSATALIDFSLSALTTASLNGNVAESYLKAGISQFCTSGSGCISSTATASGQNFVDYIRGVRTYEGVYYRKRLNVLGDIVSAEARYVKTPLQNYTDTGFSAYKSAQASRTGVVYVGANDGMLHAIDASNGKELWSYIPSKVLPNLYKLADNNYSLNHQYFIDGTPEVSEVYGPCRTSVTSCSGNEWHTILVSGLNGGGKSYFALDITDPANPVFLWEVTDSTMGYTYSSPKITKLKDGTWVVLLGSGYNNTDGKGYLYVRNALTGASIRTIPTNTVGELGRINSRALAPDTDNTSIAAYAGDTAGNLWRFDINGDLPGTASGYDAQKLISVADANGKAQPITAKPDIATVNGLTMVYFGTGKYLGVTDISNTDYQSFYGVVDRSDAVTMTTPRATGSKFIKQTLTDGLCPASAPASLCSQSQVIRTSTSNSVDWTTNNGWYMDFLGAGERSATDPTLVLGTVLFTTISPSLPASDPCTSTTSSGKSFLYALDYLNGGAVTGSLGIAAFSLGDMIATRPVPVELPDGTVGALTQGTPPKGTEDVITNISKPPIKPSSTAGVRRMSWREITSQ